MFDHLPNLKKETAGKFTFIKRMQVPNYIAIFLAKHYRSTQKQSSGFLTTIPARKKNTEKSLNFFFLH